MISHEKMRQFYVYLNLLIPCAIFFQELGALLEGDNSKIRTKRLINYSPNGNTPVMLHQVPHIVNIHRNGTCNCAGVIAAPHLIITAAHCVFENVLYVILSGSTFRDEGTPHTIERKIFHPHFNSRNFENDLALLVIDPPINFTHSPNRDIQLQAGSVAPGVHGLLSGWGCIAIRGSKKIFPDELRSIEVPVISEAACRKIYQSYYPITNRDLCTLDPRREKSSCHGDSGDPLTLNNQLIGIMSWNKGHAPQLLPDVFVNMSHPAYRNWINLHVLYTRS